MKRLVVGIDPSTTSTGLAVFDPDARELIHTALIVPEKKAPPYERIRYVADEVAAVLEGIDPEIEVRVFSENTVMRGAGGATFQRCIGAIHSRVPPWMALEDIQNTTVKKLVGGHGKAEKLQVAQGAMGWFEGTADQTTIFDLMKLEHWDITDAIAIGIAGWLRSASERSERAPT